MPALFETSNLLAVLAAGRNPEWSEQVDGSDAPDYDGLPASATAGVDLQDAVQAMVCVQLRRQAHRRTAIVTPGTIDAATTYTVTINGTAIGSTGATLAALLADIVSDINGSAVAATVTAALYDADGDGVDDSVRVYGDVEADFSVGVSVAGGTGTISATADPVSATARVWVMGASPNAPGRALDSGADPDSGDPGVWVQANAASYAVTSRGFLERFNVAGLERLYVELTGVTGHGSDSGVTYTPHVFVGPCVSESST